MCLQCTVVEWVAGYCIALQLVKVANGNISHCMVVGIKYIQCEISVFFSVMWTSKLNNVIT